MYMHIMHPFFEEFSWKLQFYGFHYIFFSTTEVLVYR
jgi:hypothetical protein